MAQSIFVSSPLEDLYKLVNHELSMVSRRISTDVAAQTAIRYNYLSDARHEIIKLMIMQSHLSKANVEPFGLVNEYLQAKSSSFFVSASPGQKADIREFSDSLTNMKEEQIKQVLENSFKQLAIGLKEQKILNQFELKDKLDKCAKLINRSKDNKDLELLRGIQFEINETIRGHRDLRTDAQKTLANNIDFIQGERIIKKINEMLHSSTVNKNKVNELYLLLHDARIKMGTYIQEKSQIISKTKLPHYNAVVSLTAVIQDSIKQLEGSYPELKSTANKTIIRSMVSNEFDKVRAEIRTNKNENKRIEALDKIRSNLVKKLNKVNSDSKMPLIENINGAFRLRSSSAESIFSKFKSILESYDKVQSKKAFSFKLFKKKDPNEEMASIIKSGLKSLEKLEKRFGLATERRRVNL